jgi:hypothetical protein
MLAPALLDLTDDLAITQGATWSLGFRINDTDGEMIDTSDMTARFKIRKTDYDGDVVASGTTEDGRIVLGFNPGDAGRNTVTVVGQQVTSAGFPFAGLLYQCITAGTTAATPVALEDTVLGGITTDGTAVWELLGPVGAYDVVNAYILLPADYTEDLVEWGVGRWDFELVDGSTVLRLFEGYARLSREVTY